MRSSAHEGGTLGLLPGLRRLAAVGLLGLALSHGWPPLAWVALWSALFHLSLLWQRLHAALLPALLLLVLEAAALPAGLWLSLGDVPLSRLLAPARRPQWRWRDPKTAAAQAGTSARGATAHAQAADQAPAVKSGQDGEERQPARPAEEAAPCALPLALAAPSRLWEQAEPEALLVQQQGAASLTALVQAPSPAACLLVKTALQEGMAAALTQTARLDRLCDALLACLEQARGRLCAQQAAAGPTRTRSWPVQVSVLLCAGSEQQGVLAQLALPTTTAGGPPPLLRVALRVEQRGGWWQCLPEEAQAREAMPQIALVQAANLGTLLDVLQRALLTQEHPAVLLVRIVPTSPAPG